MTDKFDHSEPISKEDLYRTLWELLAQNEVVVESKVVTKEELKEWKHKNKGKKK